MEKNSTLLKIPKSNLKKKETLEQEKITASSRFLVEFLVQYEDVGWEHLYVPVPNYKYDTIYSYQFLILCSVKCSARETPLRYLCCTTLSYLLNMYFQKAINQNLFQKII